jgi:hypothetical protein
VFIEVYLRKNALLSTNSFGYNFGKIKKKTKQEPKQNNYKPYLLFNGIRTLIFLKSTNSSRILNNNLHYILLKLVNYSPIFQFFQTSFERSGAYSESGWGSTLPSFLDVSF